MAVNEFIGLISIRLLSTSIAPTSKKAKCVVSDSRLVSEESVLIGFSAVSFQNFLERTESLDSGPVVLSGLNSTNLLANI
jgi:UDP-N-acetylglucosamine 2-epimerase